MCVFGDSQIHYPHLDHNLALVTHMFNLNAITFMSRKKSELIFNENVTRDGHQFRSYLDNILIYINKHLTVSPWIEIKQSELSGFNIYIKHAENTQVVSQVCMLNLVSTFAAMKIFRLKVQLIIQTPDFYILFFLLGILSCPKRKEIPQIISDISIEVISNTQKYCILIRYALHNTSEILWEVH